MPTRLRWHRPSHATVVAYLALFVALGGSSYAAITVTGRNVPKDALTGADIKNLTGRDVTNNSLDSRDVKNLLASDFRAGQLPKGDKGDPGPPGPPGPATGSAGGDLTGAYPNPTLAPSEAVILVRPGSTATDSCGGTSPPVGEFCNGSPGTYANVGNGYAPAGFFKDRLGFVHLQGSVKNVNGIFHTDVFVLPEGYRPDSIRRFMVYNESGQPNAYQDWDYLDVRPNGRVDLGSDLTSSHLSLDGVAFRP